MSQFVGMLYSYQKRPRCSQITYVIDEAKRRYVVTSLYETIAAAESMSVVGICTHEFCSYIYVVLRSVYTLLAIVLHRVPIYSFCPRQPLDCSSFEGYGWRVR